MTYKAIIRFNFSLAAILTVSYLSISSENEGSLFFALFVFGLPALIIATWLSGFTVNLIEKNNFLISILIGSLIGLLSLSIGNASWFIIGSIFNSDALGGSALVALFSIYYAGIPVVILGSLAAVASKLIIIKKQSNKSNSHGKI